MDEEADDGYVGGGYAGNTAGGPERSWALIREFLARFARQRGDAGVIKVVRNQGALGLGGLFDRKLLAAHVPGGLDFDRNALADGGLEWRIEPVGHVGIAELGTAQIGRDAGALGARDAFVQGAAAPFEGLPPGVVN